MKPYVRLYDTYLQEYKDKEELSGEMVDISEGLRSYSAGIRNIKLIRFFIGKQRPDQKNEYKHHKSDNQHNGKG